MRDDTIIFQVYLLYFFQQEISEAVIAAAPSRSLNHWPYSSSTYRSNSLEYIFTFIDSLTHIRNGSVGVGVRMLGPDVAGRELTGVWCPEVLFMSVSSSIYLGGR